MRSRAAFELAVRWWQEIEGPCRTAFDSIVSQGAFVCIPYLLGLLDFQEPEPVRFMALCSLKTVCETAALRNELVADAAAVKLLARLLLQDTRSNKVLPSAAPPPLPVPALHRSVFRFQRAEGVLCMQGELTSPTPVIPGDVQPLADAKPQTTAPCQGFQSRGVLQRLGLVSRRLCSHESLVLAG